MNSEEPVANAESTVGSSRRTRARFADQVRSQMRDAILDSVHRLLLERKWEDVRMADVATRAEVSRQTIYQIFGNRDDLARAYVLREAEVFVADLERTLTSRADAPEEALEAGIRGFLTTASTHPVVEAVLADEGGHRWLELVTTHGDFVLEMAQTRISAAILATWPKVDPLDAGLLAENSVRLAISHLSLPTAPPEIAAASLGRLFRPFVRWALRDR